MIVRATAYGQQHVSQLFGSRSLQAVLHVARDAALFEWLEDNVEKLRARDADAVAYAVERSCINKVRLGCMRMPSVTVHYHPNANEKCFLLHKEPISAQLATCS